jgi:hypothetical protein
MPKVLIADDHPLFRDALKEVVSRVFAMRGWDLVCLARISHRGRCIGAPNRRKFFCNKG